MWYFQLCFLLEATAAADFRTVSLSLEGMLAHGVFKETLMSFYLPKGLVTGNGGEVYLQCQGVCNRGYHPFPLLTSFPVSKEMSGLVEVRMSSYSD